jgi:hypothetical protein
VRFIEGVSKLLVALQKALFDIFPCITGAMLQAAIPLGDLIALFPGRRQGSPRFLASGLIHLIPFFIKLGFHAIDAGVQVIQDSFRLLKGFIALIDGIVLDCLSGFRHLLLDLFRRRLFRRRLRSEGNRSNGQKDSRDEEEASLS